MHDASVASSRPLRCCTRDRFKPAVDMFPPESLQAGRCEMLRPAPRRPEVCNLHGAAFLLSLAILLPTSIA